MMMSHKHLVLKVHKKLYLMIIIIIIIIIIVIIIIIIIMKITIFLTKKGLGNNIFILCSNFENENIHIKIYYQQ